MHLCIYDKSYFVLGIFYTRNRVPKKKENYLGNMYGTTGLIVTYHQKIFLTKKKKKFEIISEHTKNHTALTVVPFSRKEDKKR